MTPPPGPRTQAGRALLEAIRHIVDDPEDTQTWIAPILAIEAEARAGLDVERLAEWMHAARYGCRWQRQSPADETALCLTDHQAIAQDAVDYATRIAAAYGGRDLGEALALLRRITQAGWKDVQEAAIVDATDFLARHPQEAPDDPISDSRQPEDGPSPGRWPR